MDDRHRFHAEDTGAVQFNDGIEFKYWHGIEVSENFFDPNKITIGAIINEPNSEIKRLMIERYGLERFLRNANATLIHSDEFGSLYFREMPEHEPIVIVKVKNSTPEPDGTYKDYFIRVPPYITTARAAVAWTFELDETEYIPAKET